MTIGDTIDFFGTDYTATDYPGAPADFLPDKYCDDEQCKLCAVMPNYCKLQEFCHNPERPFVLVKTRYYKAYEGIQERFYY